MNDPERFEVVFHGEMARKDELNGVKHQMGELFQLDADRLEALFTGQPLVVKRNITKELAERYKRAIAQAGGFSVVVPEIKQTQALAPDEAGGEYADDSHMVTAEISTCPACLHKQLAADRCNRCNVDMGKLAIAIGLRKERDKMRHLMSGREKEALKPNGEAWRADLVQALRKQQSELLSDPRKNSLSSTFAGSPWSRLCDKVRSLLSGNTS